MDVQKRNSLRLETPDHDRRVRMKRLAFLFVALAAYTCSSAGFADAATPIAATSGAAPSHTETWAKEGCGQQGAGAGTRLVRGWLTYAEADCGSGGVRNARSRCHSGATVFCRVLAYADTNIAYRLTTPNTFFARASSSWWLHGRSGGQLTTSSGGAFINQTNGAVRRWWSGFVRSRYSRADGLMMDDQSAGVAQEFYYASVSSSSEIWSNRQLQAAHTAMSLAMTRSNGQRFFQVDNTLPPNPWLDQGLRLIRPDAGVYGLIAEGEPMSYGTLDPFYSTLLDQIAYVANRTPGFVVPLSYAAAGSSYQLQSRRVQEGTILLGYSPGHLVDWADLELGSDHLAVWPEEGIYPTGPVQSMGAPGGGGCLAGRGVVCSRGGHNDVEVVGGVYRREFRACYEKGVPFGACAAVVNTTSAPVRVRSSWLRQSYRHQIALAGGDVQSGGALRLAGGSFAAGATTIAPHDAILLAP
jgi:hypothetical protein